MADFYVTNAVAQAIANAIATANDAGTAAVIEIYAGTVPADADATPSSPTLLASLTMSATSFGSATDANPGGRITANSITADSSADNTGTAAYWRAKTQTGGTVVMQGEVATSGKSMTINTTAITAGSTVSLSAMTVTQPEGPG